MILNLAKYGFTRDASLDFTSCYKKYTGYTVGKVQVTRMVGTANCFGYKLATITVKPALDDRLPYNVYSKLPHYAGLKKLNNVRADKVTDADLTAFYNDCVEYEKEYDNAIASLKYPTAKEAEDKALLIAQHFAEQAALLELLLRPHIFQILSHKDSMRARSAIAYYRRICESRDQYYDISKFTNSTFLASAQSIEFIENDAPLTDTYCWDHLMDDLEVLGIDV